VVAGAVVVVVVAVRSDAASKPGGGGAGFPLASPTARSTIPRSSNPTATSSIRSGERQEPVHETT
jgi:hypothetical protein